MLSDKFIQKTRKLYLDTRTQRNVNKLNEELVEVQSIMTKNIQEVLGQGEKLESEFPLTTRISIRCSEAQPLKAPRHTYAANELSPQLTNVSLRPLHVPMQT